MPQEEIQMMMSVVPGAMTGISTLMGGMVSINNVFLDMTRQIDASFGLIDASIITAGTVIAQFGLQAAEAFGEFEQGMKIVQMVSGQTNDEINQLRQTANQFAVEYRTDINQITEGLQTLGRAGLNSASEQTEVLREGLSTAKLESRDLNGVLEELIQNTALLGGNLKSSNFGEDSQYVNDLLVATSMTAPITTHDVSETLKYSGGIAAAAGAKIRDDMGNVNEEGKRILEDYMGAIAAFAQKGVTGSIAGTALRAFFNKPATQDSSVTEALASIKLKPEYLWEDDEETMKPVSEQIKIIKNQMEKLDVSTMDQLQIWSKIVGGKMGQQMMKLDGNDIEDLTRDIQAADSAGNLAAGTFKTFQANMKEMTEQGQVAFRNFGQNAAIALNPLIELLTKVLELLSNPFASLALFAGFMGFIGNAISKVKNVFNLLKSEISEVFAYMRRGEELYTIRPSMTRSMERKSSSQRTAEDIQKRFDEYRSRYKVSDVTRAVKQDNDLRIQEHLMTKYKLTPEDLLVAKAASSWGSPFIKDSISSEQFHKYRSTISTDVTAQLLGRKTRPELNDKFIIDYLMSHGLWKDKYTEAFLNPDNPYSREAVMGEFGEEMYQRAYNDIERRTRKPQGDDKKKIQETLKRNNERAMEMYKRLFGISLNPGSEYKRQQVKDFEDIITNEFKEVGKELSDGLSMGNISSLLDRFDDVSSLRGVRFHFKHRRGVEFSEAFDTAEFQKYKSQGLKDSEAYRLAMPKKATDSQIAREFAQQGLIDETNGFTEKELAEDLKRAEEEHYSKEVQRVYKELYPLISADEERFLFDTFGEFFGTDNRRGLVAQYGLSPKMYADLQRFYKTQTGITNKEFRWRRKAYQNKQKLIDMGLYTDPESKRRSIFYDEEDEKIPFNKLPSLYTMGFDSDIDEMIAGLEGTEAATESLQKRRLRYLMDPANSWARYISLKDDVGKKASFEIPGQLFANDEYLNSMTLADFALLKTKEGEVLSNIIPERDMYKYFEDFKRQFAERFAFINRRVPETSFDADPTFLSPHLAGRNKSRIFSAFGISNEKPPEGTTQEFLAARKDALYGRFKAFKDSGNIEDLHLDLDFMEQNLKSFNKGQLGAIALALGMHGQSYDKDFQKKTKKEQFADIKEFVTYFSEETNTTQNDNVLYGERIIQQYEHELNLIKQIVAEEKAWKEERLEFLKLAGLSTEVKKPLTKEQKAQIDKEDEEHKSLTAEKQKEENARKEAEKQAEKERKDAAAYNERRMSQRRAEIEARKQRMAHLDLSPEEIKEERLQRRIREAKERAQEWDLRESKIPYWERMEGRRGSTERPKPFTFDELNDINGNFFLPMHYPTEERMKQFSKKGFWQQIKEDLPGNPFAGWGEKIKDSVLTSSRDGLLRTSGARDTLSSRQKIGNAISNLTDLAGGPLMVAIEGATMAIQMWQQAYQDYVADLKETEQALSKAYSDWNSAEDTLRQTFRDGNPDATDEDINAMIYETYATMDQDMANAINNGSEEWLKKLNTDAEKGTELEYDEEKADGSTKEKEQEELSAEEEYAKAVKENTGALYFATAELSNALSKMATKMGDTWWGMDGWTGWLTDQFGGFMDKVFAGGSKFTDDNEFLMTQSQRDENYAGYTEMAGLMMEDFKDARGNWIAGMRTMMGSDVENLKAILPESAQKHLYSLANGSGGVASMSARDNAKIQASMKNDTKTWKTLAKEYAKLDVNKKLGKDTSRNLTQIKGLINKVNKSIGGAASDNHIQQAAMMIQMQEMYAVAQQTIVPIMHTNMQLAASTLTQASGISARTGDTANNAGGTWGTAQVISGLVALIAKKEAKEVAWQNAYEADPETTDINGDNHVDERDKAIIKLAQETDNADDFAKEAAKRYNQGATGGINPYSKRGVYSDGSRAALTGDSSDASKAPALYIAQVYGAGLKMTGYDYNADSANKFMQKWLNGLDPDTSLTDIYNTLGKNLTENPQFHQKLIDNYLLANNDEGDGSGGGGGGSGSGDKDKDQGTKKERVDLVLCNKKEIPKLNVNLFKKPPTFTVLNKNFKLRDVKINTEDKPKAIMASIKNAFIDVQKRSDPKIIQDEEAEYDPVAATDGNALPSGSSRPKTNN